MMKKILITRPSHDITTAYLCEWSEKIIDFAKSKGMEVIDLPREKANRKDFLGKLKKFNPKIVFFNGHGSDSAICGHGMDEVLIKINKDEGLFGSKIIYSRSCDSGKKLGKFIVDKNPSSAFIGYENKFLFSFDPTRTANPLKDELAKPFLEPSNLIVSSLIKGNSAEDAHRRSQDAFQKKIDFFETQLTLEAPHISFFLKWDKFFQKVHGNLNASIMD